MSKLAPTPWDDLVAQATKQIENDINGRTLRWEELLFRPDVCRVNRTTGLTRWEKFVTRAPLTSTMWLVFIGGLLALAITSSPPQSPTVVEFFAVVIGVGVPAAAGIWVSEAISGYRHKRRIDLDGYRVSSTVRYLWFLRDETYTFVAKEARKGSVAAARLKGTLDATRESIENLHMAYQDLTRQLLIGRTRLSPTDKASIKAAIADIELLLGQITIQYQASAWHLSELQAREKVTGRRDASGAGDDVDLTPVTDLIDAAATSFNAAADSLRAQLG